MAEPTDDTQLPPAMPVGGRPERPGEDAEPIDYTGQGKRLMDACIKDAQRNNARLLRDRADMKALKFEAGGRENQWIIWDEDTSRYVERGTNVDDGGIPEFFPRPVSNLYGASIRGLTSILDQSEPAQVFAPRTDTDRDQAAAEVAEDAVPVLREECGYDGGQGHRHEMNRLCTMTSGVAYLPYYDNDERYGMDTMPLFRCNVCETEQMPADVEENDGKCVNPECDNADTESFEPVVDDLGTPIGIDAPVGKLCADIFTSFEYSVPSSARRAHPKSYPWWLGHRRMDPLDIARMWPDAQHIAADRNSWEDGGSLAKAYADEMRRLSAPNSGSPGYVSGGGSGTVDGPVVYILLHDPIVNDDFNLPEGFYGVQIGGHLFNEGPLPFKDSQGVAFKNVLIRQFEGRPGSAFGHPPSDDAVPIQESMNLTQALIELILMHDAAPTTFVPDSVTFLDEPTGVPGSWTRYRSVDGSKPTREHGMNPPSSLFAYLDSLEAKMDKCTGLNAVLRGDRPTGDPTLGEVQILEERGMATFRAPLDSLIDFEKDLSFMLLSIGRQTMWSPRFRRMRGENGQWEIKQFAAADLDGEIDIVVNRASAWPKSPLMQQLRLREALSMGVLPPPAQDPELQARILDEMSLSHLKKSLDADRKQIARELEIWKSADSPALIAPPDPLTQNLPLHFYLKQQFLKGEQAEAIRQNNPMVWEAMRQHLQAIQLILQPPAPVEPADEEPPPPGAKGELDRAVKEGRLVPDDGKPGAGGQLDELVAKGVLVPDDGTEPAPAGGAMPGAMPMGGPPQEPTGPSIDQLTQDAMARPIPPPFGGGM